MFWLINCYSLTKNQPFLHNLLTIARYSLQTRKPFTFGESDELYEALINLTEHYWVLDVEQVRLNRYQTLYFDTADFDLYISHHAGRHQVSKQSPERLTLDLNLEFCNGRDGVTLPGVAIAKVKKAGTHHTSHFIQQMRAMNVHPTGFSKYCVEVSMLYPAVKHNKFKPKLQLVHQLMQGGGYVR